MSNLIPARASRVSHRIDQVAHNLTVGQPVTLNVGAYIPARADTRVTLALGVVSEVISADSFTYISQGDMAWPAHGLTVETSYFLSATVAGALTTTAPSGAGEFVQQLVIPVDANTIRVLDYAPQAVGAEAGYDQTVNITANHYVEFFRAPVNSAGFCLADTQGQSQDSSFSFSIQNVSGGAYQFQYNHAVETPNDGGFSELRLRTVNDEVEVWGRYRTAGDLQIRANFLASSTAFAFNTPLRTSATVTPADSIISLLPTSGQVITTQDDLLNAVGATVRIRFTRTNDNQIFWVGARNANNFSQAEADEADAEDWLISTGVTAGTVLIENTGQTTQWASSRISGIKINLAELAAGSELTGNVRINDSQTMEFERSNATFMVINLIRSSTESGTSFQMENSGNNFRVELIVQ